ncbi:terminase small subunit [Citrobacter phage Ci1]|nr:terminase small subunit [Citrobacter phage Ci1]
MEKLNSEFSLENLLDIKGLPGVVGEEVVVYEKLELETVESHPDDRVKDLYEDYKLVRETIRFQRQMLMNISTIALENAKNSESPKQVEAFTKLMSEMTNSMSKMMQLHKDINEITNAKPAGSSEAAPVIKADTVFVGTPADLMQQMGTHQASSKRAAIDMEE